MKKFEFYIVFSPYQKHLFDNRRRFLISANQLANYVGENNAKTALSRASNSLTDKTTVRFRKHGKLEFYVK